MIIIEGKLEDLSKKYIPQFNRDAFTEGLTPESVIEHLYVSDPSPTKKYFEWMIKECLGLIKSNYIINNEKVGRLVNDIQEFDRNIDKLSEDFLEYNKEEIGDITYKYLKDKPLKDINTYNVDILRKIIPTLIKHKTESQRRVLAKEGAKLVYQNDNYKVYEIDTWDASCFYGSGSRWCTTNKLSDNHFRSYGTGSNKLLYVISKTKTKESDPKFYKIAINVRYGEKHITFWDAPDDPFDGWNYFNSEDSNILTFLVNYVKEKNPENYLKMLPDEYILSIKQKEEGLSDLQIVNALDMGKATNWLSYKYGLSVEDAIIKKLDILNGNVDDFLGNYFTPSEKEYLIKGGEILESRGLVWKDLVVDYYQLATIFNDYPPSLFISIFLGGDKNKALEIGVNELIISYWLAKGGKYVNDLGELYGAEKIVKYVTKTKGFPPTNLTSMLPGLFGYETPKKRKELYEIAFKFDKKEGRYDLPTYLTNQMSNESFIASFNKGDGREIEPDSYRRAFLYLKNNNPDVISNVFGVKDIVKIFKTEERSFNYLIKNYDEFSNDDLDISNLTGMFSVEVPDSIFGKYMSSWEKTNVISTYKTKEGAKKLFDFVLKKFSFKKLADIVGSDGVFQLFSIVGFKKGINYMIENKIGDIRIDDIRIQDGKVVLIVNDRSEYAFLFDEESTAENILGEDGLDWTPYDDVIYDWYDQVWDCMTPKSIELVKAWIKSNVAEYENDEGDEIDLGDTYLNEIDDDDLGKIIDEYDEFEELKRELSWAYDSAYNSVAQSDIIENTQNQLEEYLGNYVGYEPVKLSKTRYNKETGNYEKYEYSDYIYLYNAGDSLYDILYEYAATNWGYPVDYNTYFRSLLKESDPKKLYIDTDSYPDSGEVCKYFNEDLPGRI
jgi:hypothetical protein